MKVLFRLSSVCALLLCGFPTFGQLRHRVDTRDLYYRCYAIVPFVGTGTAVDPRRPKHVPAPSAVSQEAGLKRPDAPRSGIIGWTMVESDDGKSALVEYVAADRATLQEILHDTSIQSFERTPGNASQVESAFQQRRKDFSMRYFAVRVK